MPSPVEFKSAADQKNQIDQLVCDVFMFAKSERDTIRIGFAKKGLDGKIDITNQLESNTPNTTHELQRAARRCEGASPHHTSDNTTVLGHFSAKYRFWSFFATMVEVCKSRLP